MTTAQVRQTSYFANANLGAHAVCLSGCAQEVYITCAQRKGVLYARVAQLNDWQACKKQERQIGTCVIVIKYSSNQVRALTYGNKGVLLLEHERHVPACAIPPKAC